MTKELGQLFPNEHSHSHSHTHGGHTHSHDACKAETVSAEEQKERKYFQKIIAVYRAYGRQTRQWHQFKLRQWSRLPQAHRDLLSSYQLKLDRVLGCIQANQELIKAIVPPVEDESTEIVPEAEMDKLQSVFRQFVRDWSEEGAYERKQSYQVIYDALSELYPSDEDRASIRVLVPGAGLGRMVYDITKLGFSCQGNEFSFYMLLASNFILNRCERPFEFTIHPWIHSFSNHRTNDDHLQAVCIPDTLARDIPPGVEFSMSAGEFVEVYREERQQFNAVATCFFIDTAHNLIEYLHVIWDVLKPGGKWINLGPLLYHYENMPSEASIELTLEEVKEVAKKIGFELSQEQTVECLYSGNGKSMLHYQYEASFFVASKPE